MNGYHTTNDDGREPRDKRDTGRLVLAIGTASLIFSCLALGGAGYLYLHQGQKSESPVQMPSVSGDTAKTLSTVVRLIDLPSNETPQVVPLTDLSSLKNQPFFARAQVGDMLIVYVQNHLAILFNPPTGKIVNMSKISTIITTPAIL